MCLLVKIEFTGDCQPENSELTITVFDYNSITVFELPDYNNY